MTPRSDLRGHGAILDWLEQVTVRDTYAVYLGVEPTFESLHPCLTLP